MQETYANDDIIRYTYNENEDVTAQYHNSNAKPYVTYTYNADNELTEKVNTDTGLKYVYGADNKVDVYKTSDNTLVQSYTEAVTEADEETGVEAKTDITETHFGTAYSSVVKDQSVSYTTGNNTIEYSYQTTGSEEDEKVSSDAVRNGETTILSSNYTYDDNGNVLSKSYGENHVFTNTYDDKNRITSTSYAGKTVNYTYDADSQLTAVNGDNYSASYAYDSRGNITSKTVNGTETTFTYANSGWKDQLIKVNDAELTYDANGNVLTYGDRQFTWNTGRHLASITDGSNTYSYTYDEEGIRTSKNINGVTTYYSTRDGVILSQTDGTNTMYFQYDTNGTPLGFIYNGVQYFYITNQMGDVIGITDATGTLIAQYEYDEWGKLLSVTADEEYKAVANANPLRYCGYYYDTETGYYYLQSRYYDASICRFINADIPEIAKVYNDSYTGCNLFVYCANMPIVYMDLNGYSYCYKVKYAKSGSPTTKKKHFKVILTSWMATSGAKTISYSSSKSTTCEVSAKAGISAKELSAELGIKYSYTVTKGITYTYNVDKKKGKYVRIVAYIDAKKYKVKKTSYYVDVVCKWTPFGSFMYNVYTQKTRIIYLYVPIIKNNNIYIQLEYKK